MHVSHAPGSLAARVFFSLLLVVSLISPLVLTGSARSLVHALRQSNGPRPGAPEGVLPNLDGARNRLATRPSAPPSVSSTMRSRNKPLEARMGRRVGDALPVASPSPAMSPSPSRSASILEGGKNHSHEARALTTGWRAASHSHHASRSVTTTAVPQGGSPVFTDDPLVAGTTLIKGLHLTELRGAVNQARTQAGLPLASWTDSQPVGVVIRAIHVTELRTRLNEARLELGMTPASYTDPDLTVGDNVRAVHIQELRTQVKATLTTAAGIDGYLVNFYQWALLRQPYANESAYWNDIFRAAHQNGQGAPVLGSREFGRTVFESAEYAARNRTDHDYVYDLYKTYLRREPDQPSWDSWALLVPQYGREAVRRGFDESTEFLNLMGTLTTSGPPSSTVSSISSARVNPYNQPGSGLQARAAEWSVPLLSLPGRAGLDLGLSLSYSSMVWTRSGPYIYFNEDIGSPSPGFKLGFPTIQEKVFDAEAGDNVYLLTTAGGRRVELRQRGTTNLYEAGDSSYLQLIDNGSLLVRSTDGTELSYGWFNHEFRCTEIKDRNGNYLTINYDWLGQITTIVDTLAREITFNYDPNQNLTSITQGWMNGAQTHTWATFGWSTATMQSGFSGVAVVGPPNGSTIPVLDQVGLADGSRHTFEYNGAGQAFIIRSYRSDNVQRAYTAFDYQPTGDDCPRLEATRVWAENWTGLNGVPTEVITQYSDPGDGSHVLTAPDGTIYKEFYGGTGASPLWQKGLPIRTEVWSGGTIQKWTTLAWAQDNMGVNYQTNPRVTESNVSDAGSSRRTTISYQSFTLASGPTINLPSDTREYAADASTVLRRAHTDYRMDALADASYLDRHILGLVKDEFLYEVNGGVETLMSRVGFQYDEAGSIQGADAPVQHDANYHAGFVIGRGNLSSVKRYDVNDGSHSLSSVRYNTAGSVVASVDPLSHQTLIAYADSFSDSINNRNTLAYPTTVTDAGLNNSVIQYNFDFGARTRVQGPPPEGQPQGLIQTLTYDAAARLDRVTSTNNGAYKRYVYGPNYVQSFSTVNMPADEAYAIQIFDGAGQVLGAAGNHPGSIGGYSLVNTIYDAMGRAVKQSNPGEVNGSWVPVGDEAAGLNYTTQTYDWKGRPRITTNPDGTTKEASYSGCGCAGGEVITLTDEGTLDAGVVKRRQQKIYSDILGRTVKTELLNWEGGSVYSTTVNTYNARDQIKKVLQYAGPEGSITFQTTTMTYDGHGRLKTKNVPEQNAAAVTTWDYNLDNTIQKITDARGASKTLGYNSRHLVTGISYSAPAGIAVPAAVTLAYDAAGNRTLMSDGSGSVSYQFNQLSRLNSETRQFSGLAGSYTLTYDYNLTGSLKSITDPTGAAINYAIDPAGRTSAVTGTTFGGVTQYASNIQYRAWGALKHLNFGNSRTLDATFNGRLQASSFNVSGVMSKSYDYHSDGSLRFSSDLLDHKFDRSYSYDHVTRMSQAFSGAEARGEPATHDRPYRMVMGYNAFSQLTSENSSQWTAPFVRTDSYVNNRNTEWSYDADGNLLSGHGAQYTYDARGSLTNIVSEGSTALTLDGSGQRTKSVVVVFNEANQTNFTTVTYYLRSSVLGDAVVTELLETGAKKRSFVYAGTQVLAWQDADYFGGQRVVWEHRDPSNASFRATDASGNLGGLTVEDDPAELDPSGSNAGLVNPYELVVPPPDDGAGPPLLTYPNNGNPIQWGTSYTRDGIPISRSDAMELISRLPSGNLSLLYMSAASSQRVIGTRTITERFRVERHGGHPADDLDNDIIRFGDVDVYHFTNTTTVPLFGTWGFFSSLMSNVLPQNPSPNPVTQGIDQARQALQQNSLCRALFGGTNPLTLLNTYSSNNLITAGNSYPVAQSGGGTRSENFSSGDVGAVTSYAAGSYPHSTVAGLRVSANPITINQNGFYFSGRNSSGVNVNTLQGAGFYGLSLGQLRGGVIIHELLHVISRIRSDSGNPRQSRANSELVRRFCFPNTRITTTTMPLATLP